MVLHGIWLCTPPNGRHCTCRAEILTAEKVGLCYTGGTEPTGIEENIRNAEHPPNGRSRGFHKPNGLKETTHLPKGSFIPAPQTRLTAHSGSGAPRTNTPFFRRVLSIQAQCCEAASGLHPLQRSADRLKTPALRLRLFAALCDRCVLNRAKASLPTAKGCRPLDDSQTCAGWTMDCGRKSLGGEPWAVLHFISAP